MTYVSFSPPPLLAPPPWVHRRLWRPFGASSLALLARNTFPCARVNAVSIPNIGTSHLQHAHSVYNEKTASIWGGQRLQTTDHHAHVHG